MAFFKKPDTPVKNPLCVLGDKNVLIFIRGEDHDYSRDEQPSPPDPFRANDEVDAL